MKNSRFFLKAMLLIATFALYSVKLLAQDKITFTWNADGEKSVFGVGYCTVDWGDGIVETIGHQDLLSHIYETSGTYTVNITNQPDYRFRLFNCNGEQVSSLNLTECQFVKWITTQNNNLKLSELYAIQLIVNGGPDNQWFGKQILPPQTIGVGQILLPDESEFGGKYTTYSIQKKGTDSIVESDYNIVEGKLSFNVEGDYYVVMRNNAIESNWRAPLSVHIDVKVNKLGLTNNKLSKFKIYPNPTTDFVYIKTEDDNIPEVKLYSTNGKLLQHVQNTKIDLSNYAKGIYILSVNGNHMKVVKN